MAARQVIRTFDYAAIGAKVLNTCTLLVIDDCVVACLCAAERTCGLCSQLVCNCGKWTDNLIVSPLQLPQEVKADFAKMVSAASTLKER